MLDVVRKYINDNFGSRRGLIRYVQHKALYYLGAYKSACSIDFSKVTRLVFVCHGNICRSPLGEARAVAAGCRAESFGLSCRDGSQADPRAIAFSNRLGIDLDKHRSRSISQLQAGSGDLIICMEHDHLLKVRSLELNDAQVTLAGLWLDKIAPYIHDPYSSSPSYFERCECAVVAATDRIVQLLARAE